MNRITIALLIAAGVAASSARASHLEIRGSINIGVPVCVAPAPVYAPVVYAPDRGCWRDVTVNILVPGCWTTRYNRWGATVSYWVPAHYELRTQRVWVDADRDRRERWEHSRRGEWGR